MERRANNLNHNTLKRFYTHLYCLLFLAVFTTISASAQKKELDSGTRYSIKSITVTGAQNFNENTVIAFTGLKIGDRIYIPGEKLSNVTKKLWEQNLFSDIAFYVTNIEGDEVDLELYIVELPKLNEVTIEGVRKGKAKEIKKDNNLVNGTKITKNLITTTKNYIKNKYRDQGFFNTNVIVSTTPIKDSTGVETGQDMKILINKGKRVKVKSITFEGNEQIKDKKLRKFMKNVKQKNPIRIFKKSKYTDAGFEEDKDYSIK